MTPELNREEILRRFTEFLDRALTAEHPPAGIDQELLSAVLAGEEETIEPGGDSYTLWSATTALAQEVKLQGRTFKELSDSIAAQPARIADEMRTAWKDREREVQRAAEHRCQKQTVGILIDLRDGLTRGLESVRSGAAGPAQRAEGGWLRRLFGRAGGDSGADTVAALTRGYELSIERLDQALADMNACEIRCRGESFDPRRMNAIDRQVTQAAPEGTVLEVYRSGYEWNGEIFRPAQVKVACAPAAGDRND